MKYSKALRKNPMHRLQRPEFRGRDKRISILRVKITKFITTNKLSGLEILKKKKNNYLIFFIYIFIHIIPI